MKDEVSKECLRLKKKKRKDKGKIEKRKWYRYHFFGSAKVILINDDQEISADVANLSLSGVGLYCEKSIGIGEKVKVIISFIDRKGKVQEEIAYGLVNWERRFKNKYLIGICFNEELSIYQQPKLIEHLLWIIDINNLPKPFIDRRIDIL